MLIRIKTLREELLLTLWKDKVMVIKFTSFKIIRDFLSKRYFVRFDFLDSLFCVNSMTKRLYPHRKIKNNHRNWKGGVIKSGEGYIAVYSPNHPFKQGKGYVLKHRLVMGKKLKRYLTPIEVVHHINGIRKDNRIENLWLFPSNKEHISYEKNVQLTYEKWTEELSFREKVKIFG